MHSDQLTRTGGKATRSCGCQKLSGLRLGSVALTKHGGRNTREYAIWSGIVARCTNPTAHNYDHYGGRGITICDRWRSFANFLADMGARPSLKHSIDRIDNFKLTDGYSKTNCRWATSREQARNKRGSILTAALVQEIHGRVEHGESRASVARRLGLKYQMVHGVVAGYTWREFAPPQLL